MGFYRGPRIVRDGLVLALDAGSKRSYPGTGTTLYDLSGNSGTGTLSDLVYNDSYNGTLEFNGVDQLVTFGNLDSIKNLSTGTIDIWFRPATTAMTFLISWFGNSSDYMRLQVYGNSTIILYTEVGNVGTGLTSTNISPLNVWANCVITQDGTTTRMYINKILQSNTSNATWFGTHPNLSLYLAYQLGWSGYYFKGLIGPCKIYNKSLSQQEITQNFNAHKSRFGL